MPNAPQRSDPFDYGSKAPEKPFHAYLGGGDDKGYDRLPKASSELLDKTVDIEVKHPRYGPLRITWLCYTYI